MRRKKKIATVLIGLLIVALGLYVIWNGGIRLFKEWKVQLNETLMDQTELSFMPGLVYLQNDEEKDAKEWLARAAMQLIPLGSYVEGKELAHADTEDKSTYEMILNKQANDENAVDENGNLIKGSEASVEQTQPASGVDLSDENLQNFDYLVSNFYTVDSTTTIDGNQLNAADLLSRNMKVDTSTGGPKVLIYHTHSQEAFADSNGDPSTSIVGVGTYLTQLLNDTYGIPTMHHEGVYDLVDGKLDRSKAYQLAEPEIEKILKDNPSIEVVIDLHRDGIGADKKLVTEVKGKQTAQIMFFNGLSRTKENGDIPYLANPYIQDNLALSLQMKLDAEKKYPGFTRRIYLKGYRYNMHMKPKTLLVEAGAQTNTVDEMKNAMEVLAELLHDVVAK